MPRERKTTNEFFGAVIEYSANRLSESLSDPQVDPVALWQEAQLNKAIACSIEELLCPPPAPDPPEPESDE